MMNEEAKLRCRLTTKDHAMLESLLERRVASGDAIVPILRQKLADAIVVPVDQVGADIATLNSRVIFRVNGGPAETRTLVQQETPGLVGQNLSVTTPRGLCMLGLSEGQRMTLERGGGAPETIFIERIVYQPEAARRVIAERAEVSAQVKKPALRLVHSVTSNVQPLGEPWKIRQRNHDDDDPGPSAA